MKSKIFIRFSPLPEDCKSFVYNEKGIIIGKRAGVSCFAAAPTLIVLNQMQYVQYVPVMPNKPEGVSEWQKYMLLNQSEDNRRKMYIISGEFVDYDEMGCPIVKNPKVLRELNYDEIFYDEI